MCVYRGGLNLQSKMISKTVNLVILSSLFVLALIKCLRFCGKVLCFFSCFAFLILSTSCEEQKNSVVESST